MKSGQVFENGLFSHIISRGKLEALNDKDAFFLFPGIVTVNQRHLLGRFQRETEENRDIDGKCQEAARPRWWHPDIWPLPPEIFVIPPLRTVHNCQWQVGTWERPIEPEGCPVSWDEPVEHGMLVDQVAAPGLDIGAEFIQKLTDPVAKNPGRDPVQQSEGETTDLFPEPQVFLFFFPTFDHSKFHRKPVSRFFRDRSGQGDHLIPRVCFKYNGCERNWTVRRGRFCLNKKEEAFWSGVI